jgi:hypothetical protein
MIVRKVATRLVEMLKTPSPLRGTPPFQRESWRVEPSLRVNRLGT